jgi:hypothetical protein
MSNQVCQRIAPASWLRPAARWFALLAFAIAGVLAATAPVGAAIPCAPGGPTFNLTTARGYFSTPDGNSVFMWGYRRNAAGEDFQMPGPVLCVTQGQTVRINLTNPDPANAATPADTGLPEATSLVFPGQTDVLTVGGKPSLFTSEIGPGPGTVSYQFIATQPGTYLYESGTNPHKQVEMGLYGLLIVRPITAPATQAYNDAATTFNADQQYFLVLHEVDPFLHQAVEFGGTFDQTVERDRYFTVNGRAFPDSIQDANVPWLPGQPYTALVTVGALSCDPAGAGGVGCAPTPGSLPALIRFANAGLKNHPFHPHGNHVRVIARDGRELGGPGFPAAKEQFTRTIGSGQTSDLLARWINEQEYTPVSVPPAATDNPIPPEAVPEQQNVAIKDDATFYSGSPYLGVKDSDFFLPAVTSYNECGEFYYPWHSHALNEFVNFNEGFGGMATLWRVNPPAPNTCP